jgi:hypothetical protein
MVVVFLLLSDFIRLKLLFSNIFILLFMVKLVNVIVIKELWRGLNEKRTRIYP